MRLSWNLGYEDYKDTENWNRRYQEICSIQESFDSSQLERDDQEVFLDKMEALEELLRFYTAQIDFAKLEPVMRQFQKGIEIGNRRSVKHIGFIYLKMVFARVNGMLYRSQDQNRQSAEYYAEFVRLAESCFAELKTDKTLLNQQVVYVGWACVEGAFEAVQIFDKLLETKHFVQCCTYIYNVTEWLKPYLLEATGICEKTSEICATIAGLLYQAGESKLGAMCMSHAIHSFEELDRTCNFPYYGARALWTRGQQCIIEFTQKGSVDGMMQCEADTQQFLMHRAEQNIDKAIAKGVLGLINLQRSVVIQQGGNLTEAIEVGNTSYNQLSDSLMVLEKEYESCNEHLAKILKDMASKLFANCLAVLDSLGVQCYYAQDNEGAKDMFMRAVKMMESNQTYSLTAVGFMMMKGEIYFYLGLIYVAENDANKASFYATQSADILYELMRTSPAQNVVELLVASCSCTSEIMLMLKQKTDAAKYASMGLEACDMLARIAPKSERLQMRSLLEKYYKKALRKSLFG